MSDSDYHAAACHCGAVKLRIRLSNGFDTARRCTCSLCRMRGAVVVTAMADGVEIVEGEDRLSLYQFNTSVARHFFCATCGIYTHHRRRSDPDQYGVNVACIEGVSPFDFHEVIVTDGVNHPSDNDGRSSVAGVLRFEPTG